MSAADRVRRIMAREVLEQRRQPVMLLTIGTLFVLVDALGIAGTVLLDGLLIDPDMADTLTAFAGEGLLEQVPGLQDGVLVTTVFLGVSQYLGVCAVLAGHGMLHERQCGTFTFLLLAPVRRLELLVGKVAGALALPTLLYLVTAIVTSALMSGSDAAMRAPWFALPSPSWIVGIGLAGPAWTLACASACTLISAHTADVRTAQQGVWLLVFFATVALGPLLTATLPAGPGMQLLSAAAGALASATLLYTGALLTRRDLSS